MTIQDPTMRATEEFWRPAQIRLSVFLRQGSDVSGIQWWEELTDSEPDTMKSQPKTKELDVEGSFGSGKLLLSANPARIDWRYAVAQDITPQAEFATLGPFGQSLSEFSQLMDKWLKRQPVQGVARLAFGAVLFHSVPSLSSGYEQLTKFLHSVNVDPVGSSDMLFQINRPRSSTLLPGLRINRLTKWAVVRLQSTLITDTPGGVIPQDDILASHLELDINTDKEYQGSFLPEGLPSLFGELVRLGAEIAERGDIE